MRLILAQKFFSEHPTVATHLSTARALITTNLTVGKFMS